MCHTLFLDRVLLVILPSRIVRTRNDGAAETEWALAPRPCVKSATAAQQPTSPASPCRPIFVVSQLESFT
jgi:hypothetical protein